MTRVAHHFLALLVFAGFVSTTGHAQDVSFQVEPYLQFGIDTMMVVMWETTALATTKVEFGKSRIGDEVPNLSQSQVVEGRRTMHEVVLGGLEKGTKYFWRVVSVAETGERLESEPSTFRTAIGEDDAFAFVLYSDTQSNPETWGRVSELGWKERPNFGVIAGDLVGTGGNLDHWLKEFFPSSNVIMKRLPLFTVIGNHEDDHPYYYQYMHNPEPEYRYTFTYGNTQFFMIDTNRDVTEGSDQWIWLEHELAKSTATWKIAMHHHPPYSSEENDHGDSWTGTTVYGTGARNLVPLYEQYGVDFCLFGHVHMYERTWPIFEGEVNQQNGVIYINAGGAGGGLENFAPTRSWFSAKVKSVHHYGYFAIHDRTMIFQAIDEFGNLFDHFELTKEDDGNEARAAALTKPPAPKMTPDGGLFGDQIVVEFEAALEDMKIHYTLDGSEPTAGSPVYSGPVTIRKSATLKAVAVSSTGASGRVRTAEFEKASPKKAMRLKTPRPGLAYAYYEGAWKRLPDFTKLDPKKEGATGEFDPASIKDRRDAFGIVFSGYVNVPETGIYTFETHSDDGSRLFIDEQPVVDNDGSHGAVRKRGQVALQAGWHAFRIDYFDDDGGESLNVSWGGPGVEWQHLRSSALSH